MIPVFQNVVVSGIVEVARATFVLSFEEPESAAAIEPGRFCMISPEPHESDVFLPRPFSYYRVIDGRTVQVLFRVFGRATRWMAGLKPDDRIGVFGPLGNTFTLPVEPRAGRVVLVAGGVGLPPLVMLAGRLAAMENPPEIDLVYGERAGADVVDLGSVLPGGVRLHLCTEDGSAGTQALATDLFRSVILAHDENPLAVYTCGPTLMMASLADCVSAPSVVLFEASTEEHMACGKGICKGCAVPLSTGDDSFTYRYCCTDGPVFNAFEVKWPKL
ncbi:MAG: hypothetical protein U9P14_04785 [Gemmatimonadota bacterium]|nr:hypothetical protein [Gemmatimonadota bacterium]